MAKKLFVGSLPYSVTQGQLQELFAQAGAVDSVAVIIDRETGQSKGFGFIEMSNDDEANAAIAKFNGYNLDGRSIVVNEARPQEPRRSFGGGSGGGGGFNRDRRPRY